MSAESYIVEHVNRTSATETLAESRQTATWQLELRQAVRDVRELERLLELGGVSYAVVKLAFTDKKSYQFMASQMCGVTEQEYVDMMLAGGRSLDGWRSKSERGD